MSLFDNVFTVSEKELEDNFDSEFDIARIDVISVERGDNHETIINYYDDNVIEESIIITSAAKHRDYIERFREKLKQKQS